MIVPEIRAGKRILISAHGNSLRALVKHLDDVSAEDIVHLNIPTGIPLVYELDDGLRPIKNDYLGDSWEVKKPRKKSPNRPRHADSEKSRNEALFNGE